MSQAVLVTMAIPKHLLSAVAEILRNRQFPDDDDGITTVIIMEDTGCSVDEFVQAEGIVTDFDFEVQKLAKEGT